jgi:hypothetical protein
MKLKLHANILIGLACVTLLGISASAQGGEIVEARYGVRGRGADVTNLVRSFVRDDRLRFEVTNENLGGDPAPHRRKELLLRVRERDGDVREYRYAEKSVVDMVVERGGGYGDAGHDHDRDNGRDNHEPHDDHGHDHDGYGQGNYRGLQILRASYGAEGQFVDVTGLLQGHVQDGNRLSMHINNDTMGVDPAPHAHKELRVQYVYNGDRRDTVVPESGDLRIP